VNVARNRRRSARRSPVEASADGIVEAATSTDPESQAVEHAMRARLREALALLDEPRRVAFVLFEIDDVPMTEVAQALGVSLATAYRRLDEAREALRAALREGDAT
jgi:RNA polymerase sigma-70 factor (ECF subfamily)